MSASDLCKEGLVAFFNNEGIMTKASDWKRCAKLKINDGNYLRRFENDVVGLIGFIDDEILDEIEEPDEIYVHEGGDLWFDIRENPEPDPFFGRFTLMFVSKTFWERNHCFPDQQWGHVLHHAYNIPEDLLDEVAENTFVPNDSYTTKEAVIAALEGFTVEFNPNLLSSMD